MSMFEVLTACLGTVSTEEKMNIYYFNVEHIISSYWRYLIEVLKVSHVFSFINPSQMDEESKTQLSPYLRLYNTIEET